MSDTKEYNPDRKSRGFVWAAIVVMVVLGRWGWVSWEHFKVRRMADELNIPGNFWGAPMANKANTAFIFGERSEKGINVYLHRDQTNITIGEFVVGEFNALTLRLLDWSPDDKNCAFTRDGGIFIYDGSSGRQVAAVNTGGDAANFAWLSPSKFVVLNGLSLDEFDDQKSYWSKKHLLTLTNTASVTAFYALDDHSFVWRQVWDIWAYDLKSDRPLKVWHSGGNQLADFTVNANGSVLLNCGRWGGSLLELSPFFQEQFNSDWGIVKSVGELETNNCFVMKVSNINHGRGKVYLAADSWERDTSLFSSAKDRTLLIKKDEKSKPIQILGAHEIVEYSLQDNDLYIVGSETNEPPSLWKYDLAADSLTRVYSSIPKYQYASLAKSQYYVITNESGQVATTYRLWSPVKMVPGKKYPLMIGQTPYKWEVNPQVAANCGYYFACASRPSWGAELQSWNQDVMNVYHELAKNPCIDTNRIFLYGVSVEAYYANESIKQQPELWRGAYLEGAAGPDPSLLVKHPLKIHIIAGKQDSGLNWISNYLERATSNGQSVRVALKDGGHSWLSGASLGASARSLAEFLNEEQ